MSAIRRVGSAAELLCEDGAPVPFLASIQPDRSLCAEDAGPLGVSRARRYILYAPPSRAAMLIGEDSRIQSGGLIFRALRAETFRISGAALYRRVNLELAGEGEEV